ncbi:hypothetical protein AVEN_245535-1 [Araneus ventricosus]|uniref:Uncharacterized protein n=1 Tax=Araneus ventricosus TaxID=182803 RepID=A0A4Y2JU95_ARAVE|nr:hypothetical protein AVEN_245535-1 [Araneus ventricosus]
MNITLNFLRHTRLQETNGAVVLGERINHLGYVKCPPAQLQLIRGDSSQQNSKQIFGSPAHLAARWETHTPRNNIQYFHSFIIPTLLLLSCVNL